MIIFKDGNKIQALPITDHVKYLGQQLNFVDHTDKDTDERIAKAGTSLPSSERNCVPKEYRKRRNGCCLNPSSQIRCCMVHAHGP